MRISLLTLFFVLVRIVGYAQSSEDRYLIQAQNFFERGEYAKADMNCDASLKRNPHSGKAYLLKAKCQYAWDHHQCNYESKKFLDSADKYSENKYEVYLMKAINSTCCGDKSKAEFYLNQLKDFEEKDIQYDFVKGYYLYIKKDFEGSKVLLKNVLSTSKDLTTSWNANYYIGYILFYQEKFDEAITNFKACLKVTPNSAEINTILGTVYAKKTEFKEALSYHNAAIDHIEDPSKAQNANHYYQRGVTLLTSGSSKKAVKDFEQAKNSGKEDVELFYYLGKSKMLSGDFCGASTSFYESKLKLRGKEDWKFSFGISNLYYFMSYVNVKAYCDNIELENLEKCKGLFNEKNSEYDLAGLKVIHASYLIQSEESSATASKICKMATEGLKTRDEEMAKVANKIIKAYCN